jgi:hypothetical protein
MDAILGVEGAIDTPGELVVLTEGLIRDLPPILTASTPGRVEERVEQFFLSVARIFDAWVARRSSKHTQRAYRQDVMAFVAFRQIAWPGDATALFRTSVADVHAWRDQLVAAGAAPKTLNADFHGRKNNQSSDDCRGQW